MKTILLNFREGFSEGWSMFWAPVVGMANSIRRLFASK